MAGVSQGDGAVHGCQALGSTLRIWTSCPRSKVTSWHLKDPLDSEKSVVHAEGYLFHLKYFLFKAGILAYIKESVFVSPCAWPIGGSSGGGEAGGTADPFTSTRL